METAGHRICIDHVILIGQGQELHLGFWARGKNPTSQGFYKLLILTTRIRSRSGKPNQKRRPIVASRKDFLLSIFLRQFIKIAVLFFFLGGGFFLYCRCIPGKTQKQNALFSRTGSRIGLFWFGLPTPERKP